MITQDSSYEQVLCLLTSAYGEIQLLVAPYSTFISSNKGISLLIERQSNLLFAHYKNKGRVSSAHYKNKGRVFFFLSYSNNKGRVFFFVPYFL